MVVNDVEHDYFLAALFWRFGSLRLTVEPTHLPCCARALAAGDVEHLKTESYQHRIKRDRLDERFERSRRLCRHAEFAARHWGKPPRPTPPDARQVVTLDIDGVLQ
jgi:hypothetical protein